MFKTIITLFRGATHDAEEAFADRHALSILNQQMRDSAVAVEQARKAVAVAMAQNRQEADQFDRLVARIADLEARTIAAIEQEKEDLAREAAETIALLEAERDASAEAQKQFAAEIARLRANVRNAEMKLRELQRGQRIATATDKAHKLREVAPQSGLSTLREAEETLLRLRTRQKQIDLTDAAMAEMDASGNPSAITEKLAEAGCGTPLKTSADDVLARLKAARTGGAA
ncbi:MAG: PspA/IM30 family protein [Notoacmeibacter sp.]|nr:PspA/IM30 family protein [Notoacmeibacter sp.]MCC0032316.1 PspA/IM30 family protein [Brucellaceae bacterium]